MQNVPVLICCVAFLLSGYMTGGDEGGAAAASQVAAFEPNPRINCVQAHNQNTVYMYGGLYEPGDKQVS